MSVLQFAENLSDRAAADAVRTRIDWKYALGLELDDPGFDYSVLCEFRARLAEDGAADRLLEVMLQRLKEAGLLKPGGRQRTDATHVLGRPRAPVLAGRARPAPGSPALRLQLEAQTHRTPTPRPPRDPGRHDHQAHQDQSGPPERSLNRRYRIWWERPHSTGVESTTPRSSLHSVVSRASVRVTRRMRPAALRTVCCIRSVGEGKGTGAAGGCWRADSHRASEVKPSIACIIAKVTSSTSLSRGTTPTVGRQGVSCGESFRHC